MEGTQKDLLMVFDFDQTIIYEDSDEAVIKLLPNNKSLQHSLSSNGNTLNPITNFNPHSNSNLKATTRELDQMARIFEILHQSGVKKEDILTTIERLNINAGFKELLKFVNQLKADIIIISDSNHVFIDHFLKHHHLDSYFSEVFTNPSHFDSSGILKVSAYHYQDWCSFSRVNMCKGYVMQKFLKKQQCRGVHYKRVAYVGDGSNDYCPSICLTSLDIIFPRKEFDLEFELLANHEEVKATVVPWTSGFDIIKELEMLV